jgi:hypothetical protein
MAISLNIVDPVLWTFETEFAQVFLPTRILPPTNFAWYFRQKETCQTFVHKKSEESTVKDENYKRIQASWSQHEDTISRKHGTDQCPLI